ncbi:uridylate kinase [Mesotoga sp. SC_4PWA21]|nr:uridylate kinase [Mesotoga sp. SC_4PWA21]
MYRRVLLKLSGEVLSGEGGRGFASEMAKYLIEELKPVIEKGVQLAIVIGAGNIVRGRDLSEMRSSRADELGILGTIMNSLYLKELLCMNGLEAIAVSSAAGLPSLVEHRYDIIEGALNNGKVVVFGGGTYLPFFTTDTAAAIRAVEIAADVLIKGTKVDGVYSKDPKLNGDAKKIDRTTFSEAIRDQLNVMDMEAFSICQRYGLPVRVIDFFIKGNLFDAIIGGKTGTVVLPD